MCDVVSGLNQATSSLRRFIPLSVRKKRSAKRNDYELIEMHRLQKYSLSLDRSMRNRTKDEDERRRRRRRIPCFFDSYSVHMYIYYSCENEQIERREEKNLAHLTSYDHLALKLSLRYNIYTYAFSLPLGKSLTRALKKEKAKRRRKKKKRMEEDD